jgi:serine acetyltransferase
VIGVNAVALQDNAPGTTVVGIPTRPCSVHPTVELRNLSR